jgi:hypothetical protein
MPDIRDGLMCRKCRDWPKLELRLAKRREWKQAVMSVFRQGRLHDDDMLAALMCIEKPEVLDHLCMPPPVDLTADQLLEMVGIK